MVQLRTKLLYFRVNYICSYGIIKLFLHTTPEKIFVCEMDSQVYRKNKIYEVWEKNQGIQMF